MSESLMLLLCLLAILAAQFGWMIANPIAWIAKILCWAFLAAFFICLIRIFPRKDQSE